MARQPKPWHRASRGLWFFQRDGRQRNLGRDRKLAFQRFHELMARPRQRSVDSTSVTALIDAFLEWTQKHRARGTYD